MYRLLVLSVAVAAAVAGPLAGDNPTPAPTCVSWDDKINTVLLQPLVEQLKKSDSQFIKLADQDLGFFGVGVQWKNASAGDFSSLKLNLPASQLCTDGNTKTLTVNLGFGNLQAGFDSFLLYTPIFNIGGSKTTLSLSGENLNVQVSATTDPTSKKCTASLGSLLFNNWGALQLDLGDGMINMLISKIFNAFASTRIIGVLETFNVGAEINGFAVNYMTPVMNKYSDMVCTALAS